MSDLLTRRTSMDEEIPRHIKKAKKKRFGLRSTRHFLGRNWTYTNWYATEKARDQAAVDLVKHTTYFLKDHPCKYERVER